MGRQSFQMDAIGQVRSCFSDKFAIPRQPSLAPSAQGRIQLYPPYNQSQALSGLEQVSHIWVLFIFHHALEQQQRLQVRPPRLGGNQRLGVFASRSSHRPNSLGQSVVHLDGISPEGQLLVSGIDMLDGTPVIDIKPYIPFVDAIPNARNSIAEQPPEQIQVHWQSSAKQQALHQEQLLQMPVVTLIEECLAQDPRPAYQQPEPHRRYGTCFYNLNVIWHYPAPDRICVLGVTDNPESPWTPA